MNSTHQEKIVIERWRRAFIFTEHDTSNITDEEVKESIRNVAKTIGSFGATSEEAATALRALGNAT